MNIENLELTKKQVTKPLKILVVGASRGTGRATVEKLLKQGHYVTAFSRSTVKPEQNSNLLVTINGDATNPVEVEEAVRGQDVVIVTLGITENPLRVRFFGTSNTPVDIRSTGTKNIIVAMHKYGVKRLVVQSSYGVGETRGLLRFIDRLFFNLILKPQIEDTEIQEKNVRNSGLDWVLAQPVHLTNEDSNQEPYLSEQGQTRIMKAARQSVVQFLAFAACRPDYIGKSVSISG